jgi:hypothetical protein
VSSTPVEPVPTEPESVPAPEPVAAGSNGGGGIRRRLAMAGAVAVGAAAIVGGVVLFGGEDENGGGVESSGTDTTTTVEVTTTTEESTTTTEPRPPRFVEINDIVIQDGTYVISFVPQGFTPQEFPVGSLHGHFFWDTEERSTVGQNGVPETGQWRAYGQLAPLNDPLFFSVAQRPAEATSICALVATHDHNIADVDGDGEVDLDTGNCFPLPPA